jgi:hypothetical protein
MMQPRPGDYGDHRCGRILAGGDAWSTSRRTTERLFPKYIVFAKLTAVTS